MTLAIFYLRALEKMGNVLRRSRVKQNEADPQHEGSGERNIMCIYICNLLVMISNSFVVC